MKILLPIFCLLLTIQSFAQSYTNVESVEYDPSQNRFLVSNGFNILQRSSDGTLSYFGDGAATHGMEVLNGKLFAIQGDNINAFDLATEDQEMTLTINGAGFLNGLTNNGANTLWATDFSNQRIYEIDVTDINNPSYSIVVSSTGSTPNGIIYDGDNNRLIFVSWGSTAAIKAVDLSDYSVSTITTTTLGNIDGIDEDNDGNYYISHWSPAGITKYNSDFTTSETINVPGIFSPADICYAKEIDTLAIPNDGSDVLYVGFETTPVTQLVNDQFQFSLSPNPMITDTQLRFKIVEQQDISIDLFDIEGRLVKSILNQELIAGWHQISVSRNILQKGIYIIHMRTNKGIITDRLVIK